jgi:5-methyltetrahydropteroyltriglutamate--homocysteine methyltransferase
MPTLVDDVGSFPLPPQISMELFEKAYVKARQGIIKGIDIRRDEFLLNNFHRVIIDSFKKKCATGLDIINYPQHYDMHKQIADLIHDAMDKGTYMVDEEHAIIPEVQVINEEAKRLHEDLGKRVPLRVCIVGPLELYLKIIGTTLYEDILVMFAETTRRFARNSILNSKCVRTEVISLDEPSFGFQDVSANRDVISDVLEKAFDFSGPTKQIHLHSSSRITEILNVKNLDVLSLEFGASPKNIENLSRKTLDKADKLVRVGIARTDIDSINAELRDKGITKPRPSQIVENEEIIRKRFMNARGKYGNRLAFTGPDCGLGGWPTQGSAQLLLKKTVEVVRSSRNRLR